MRIEVTIGWTRSDMANGYSSFSDGYRPGASQHTETIAVEVDDDHQVEPERIADAAFLALNHPEPETLSCLASQIHRGVTATGYNGRGAHYSLSTGDTVTVGEIALACAPCGWERVSIVTVITHVHEEKS